MEHIMPGEVLWCCTDGDAGLEDLQTDICPFADGFEVDATVDKCLCEVFPARPKSVCANSHGSRHFIGFKEFDGLVEL